MVETYTPLNLQEALEIRNREKTIVFAGGSDLMVKHRVWSGAVPNFASPLLFIGHLEELQGISISDDKLKIGTACTLALILNDDRVPEYVKAPITEMASPAIRNIGTIGGNICNSSPAGDTLPMLYALDAKLTIQSQIRTEIVDIKDFIVGPGQNLLKPDQIVTEISIPLINYSHFFYKKVGARNANRVSKISFYAIANSDSTQVHDVKISFGAVGPTVARSNIAENLLKGIKKTEIPYLLDDLTALFASLISPIDDIRSSQKYRQKVSLRILEHYLLKELVK